MRVELVERTAKTETSSEFESRRREKLTYVVAVHSHQRVGDRHSIDDIGAFLDLVGERGEVMVNIRHEHVRIDRSFSEEYLRSTEYQRFSKG